MQKTKEVSVIFLNLFFVVILSFLVITGCGKKDDGTKSGDNKETSSDKKSGDLDKISENSPFHVKFEISGTMKGTVDAYYHNKKSKSTSSMEVSGQKMSATAYFDGGEYVYIISEFGGMKKGMKYKKGEYESSKKEGEFDAVTFKDRLKDMDKIGQEEILGKTCDIYKSKDGKYQVSIYKEMVPLKFSSGEGKVVMVAKEFETDAKFSDDIFTPPSDITYMDSSDMMNEMKNMKGLNGKLKNLDDKTKEMEDIMKKYNK